MRAWFRFYAELNDHLPPHLRAGEIAHDFFAPASVKDRIEALDVPHAEVDLILVNGVSVDFSYLVRDGDRISVYPVFESLDIGPVLKVRPHPLRELRFLLDVHLGRLAVYLRLLGFDAAWRNQAADRELVLLQQSERRILLTRDRGLLKHRQVERGYWVRSTDPRQQAIEIVRRFDLLTSLHPFRLCLRCSMPLEPVAKDSILDRLPPRARQHHDDFLRCPKCDRLYWKGSHFRRMQAFVDWVIRQR